MKRFGLLACFPASVMMLSPRVYGGPCLGTFKDFGVASAKGTGQFLTYPVGPFMVQWTSDKAWGELPVDQKSAQPRPTYRKTFIEELFGARGLLVAAAYLPFVLYGPTIAVYDDDLIEASPEFEDIKPDDVVLIVESFNDSHRGIGKHEARRLGEKSKK